MASGNYSENFSTVATWAALTTAGNATSNSFSGLAVDTTGVIPSGTRITTASTAFSSGSSGGLQKGTENIQLLSTGATPSNSSSTGVDLNLSFTGRSNGNLSFNAATAFNGNGDRQGTLRVYYTTNGTAWTEITGGGLPYIAINNVAGSAAISAPIPAAVNDAAQVKLRFYYHNDPAGTTGSRPKISIDDVSVTSSASGVPDTTPPQIASLSPANGATGVSIGTNLVATFNENVVAGTGNIVITRTSGNLVFATIPVGDPQVTISGSTLTINPTADLALGTAYNVQIAAGAVKDAANNNFAGITNATTWAFTTIPPDTTAPTLVSVTPADDSTLNAPPDRLTMTFSEPVSLSFFSETYYVTVTDSLGNEVAAIDATTFNTEQISVSGSVATILLPVALEFGKSYHVEVDAGAFTDEAGNEYAGITGSTAWNFSVADVPGITTGPGYTQDFAGFTSATNLTNASPLLPPGWSVTGLDLTYDGVFGVGSTGGFRGGANVLGYQHTGDTGTLVERLSLRNASGAPITNLVVSYTGRDAGPAEVTGRHPAFTVRIDGTEIPALAYTTSAGDNQLRTANLSGLNIPAGATFSISWSSDGPTAPGIGSRRQIGISSVSVAIGTVQIAPTVTASVPLSTLTYNSAGFNGTVVSAGSAAVTARGFVYSVTATNPAPTIGGTGVTTITDPIGGNEPYTGTANGLTPATSYTVRAYATSTVGTSYSTAVTFTTLPTPPSFTGSYEQPFDDYDGNNPAGWSAVSSGGGQAYAGLWGNTGGSGGFLGGVNNPGVLGYQHTGSTQILTTKLTLFNGTGATITQLPISYLGRVSRTGEGRSPAFVVSVNDVAVPALAYSTEGNVDLTVSTTVTGLNIAPGAAFTITWVSDRGLPGGSSKQIGLGEVVVGTGGTPPGNTFATWAAANAGGQGPLGDFDNDGVSNGVEYFFGATGSTFTPNPVPVAGVISYPRDATATNATYKVFTSPNLVTWTDVTASTTIDGGFVRYTIPTGQGKLFVRLQVVVAP